MGLLDTLRAAFGLGTEARPAPPESTADPQPRHITISVRVERPQGPPEGYESPYLPADRQAELLVPRPDGLPPLHLSRYRGELWLTEDTTGKLVNVKARQLRSLGIWGATVRGASHYETKARLGPAELVREPDNPYDANAVAIHVGGKIIDHYNKQKAAALAKVLDGGEPLIAQIISVNPPKVIATRAEVLAHLSRRLCPPGEPPTPSHRYARTQVSAAISAGFSTLRTPTNRAKAPAKGNQ
ncbi:hypothetical protein AB0E56_11155 [Microbacterium sp. NPDC028030]|uniref:hypothetical protein n=1 Tax=Microbacterium sp. NPDC028030 TaxID=3155124 RepID=UPI0033EC19B9